MRPMPCRTQPATISGSVHCCRTVAALSESSAESGIDAVRGEQRAHPRARKLSVADQARRIGEAEHAREMRDRARALLPADQREVRLVAVQPREEHDPGLVEARWRAEDVARQRD